LPSEALFGGVFARGPVAAEVTSVAWLQAMLDVEAALARVTAPGRTAERIADACRAEDYDVEALATASVAGGNPVIPLVAALRDRVGRRAAPHVHEGATSQDVLDTAAMLVSRRSLAALWPDARAAAEWCAALAREHRDTPMIGRTLLRQGLPITFGLKAASWLSGIDRARAALEAYAPAAQLGGPVGTGSPATAAALAQELGLAAPALPWHSERSRVLELAAALATLTGALGRVGRDVTLLAQDEVNEVRVAEAGGSSSMDHKRNPISAVTLVACADRAPGLLATLAGAMVTEHERAAGAWHAEWEPLSDLLRLTGSAAAWARELLNGLVIDSERMAANLADAVKRHGISDDTGAAGEIVDRALQEHR
jgi:3-carboxy-cis,cis-muconate cycloisomerase